MKKFVALDHIKDFNLIKKSLNTPFTKAELQTQLKKVGIPANAVFFATLVKYKVLKRISRSQFIFSNNDPIYFKLLENAYKDYSGRLNKYMDTYRENKAKKSQEVQDAIQLLKNLGYEIYAPEGELYSKL